MVVYSNGFKWNPENEKTLKELWMQGLKSAEIAKAVGTGRNSIIGKARRLGLPTHPSNNKKPKPVGVSVNRIRAVRLPRVKTQPLQETSIMLPIKEPSSDPKDWIPFMADRSETCHAILGKDAATGLALFCPNEAEGSYCPFHNEIYYDHTPRERRR